MDIVKYIARLACITLVIGAAIVIVTGINFIPAIDWSVVVNSLSFAYSVITHWIPWFPYLWTITLGMLGIWLTTKMVVPLAMLAMHILGWINQG